MNFPTKLCVMAAAIVLAACGGGGDGDTGGAAGPGSHLYYSMDFAPSGDFTGAQRVDFPHQDEAAQVRLGNSNITFEKNAQGEWAADGYRHVVVGEAFNAEQGALLLCKQDENDMSFYPDEKSRVWHAILPANAQPVAPNIALDKLVIGSRYNIYAECEKTNESFVVAPDGGLDVEIDGVTDPEDHETRDTLKALLSNDGYKYPVDSGFPDGAWEDRLWLKVYQVGDKLLLVFITQFVALHDGEEEYWITVAYQE